MQLGDADGITSSAAALNKAAEIPLFITLSLVTCKFDMITIHNKLLKLYLK